MNRPFECRDAFVVRWQGRENPRGIGTCRLHAIDISQQRARIITRASHHFDSKTVRLDLERPVVSQESDGSICVAAAKALVEPA